MITTGSVCEATSFTDGPVGLIVEVSGLAVEVSGLCLCVGRRGSL